MHQLEDRRDNNDEQQNTGGMPSGFTLQRHLPKPFATKAMEISMGKSEADDPTGGLFWENCSKCGRDVPLGDTIDLVNCNGETLAYACSFCAGALQLQHRLYTEELQRNIQNATSSLAMLKTCLWNAKEKASKFQELLDDKNIQGSLKEFQSSLHSIQAMLVFLEEHKNHSKASC